jgi:hypothetical protein
MLSIFTDILTYKNLKTSLYGVSLIPVLVLMVRDDWKISNIGAPISGRGRLHTVALRPTLLYGEQDPRLVPSLVHLAEKMDGSLVRFAGSGGRQQITYVGKSDDFTVQGS